MLRNADFAALEDRFGIHVPEVLDYMPPNVSHNYNLAMDAQPGLISVSSNGIPAFLANYMDPKVIQVLTTPNKAAQILGEAKKGDWVTRTMMFPMVESTGETSAFGDFSNNGSVSANTQFPQRQSFHYQTITQWGEKQLAEAGLAKIDWASRLNIASTLVLDKFQTQTYFFGVNGLHCYGLLNDPSLPPTLVPGLKAAGGRLWSVATANEVYADVQAMFADLVSRTQGLITRESKMVLATAPGADLAFTNTNSFNVNVYDQLKKNYPNIRFETAPQYATQAGNLVQLIAEQIDGQETGYCAFTEKLRAHGIVKDVSSYKEKKSQGTWGAVIFLPVAFSQLLGV